MVWRKVHKLALEIYQITQSFPKEEMSGITSQSHFFIHSKNAILKF